jgi:hypothetical protein
MTFDPASNPIPSPHMRGWVSTPGSKGVHARRSQPGPISRLPAVPGGRSDRPAGHEPKDAEGDEGSLPAVWVQPIRLSATIAAATFLSLRDAGTLKLHLQEITSKDPSYKMPPGRLRTHTTLTVAEAEVAPQEGLAGALVAIACGLPDGLLGEFRAGGRLVDLIGLPDGTFAYPFVRNLVRSELLDSGYYTRSQRFRVQPDCQRIATLEQARNATVRWWEQQQAADARLCAALVAVCKRASTPLTGGGG